MQFEIDVNTVRMIADCCLPIADRKVCAKSASRYESSASEISTTDDPVLYRQVRRCVPDPSTMRKISTNRSSFHRYALLLFLLVSNASAFAPSPIMFGTALLKNGDRPNFRPRRTVIRNSLQQNAEAEEMADGDIHSEKTLTAASQNNTGTSTGVRLTGLRALGWQPYFAEQFTESDMKLNDDDDVRRKDRLFPVRIAEILGQGFLHVLGDGIDRILPPSGRRPDDEAVCVGDWILINGEDRQTKILERKSLIKRKAPGRGHSKTQLIAANLDVAFVVTSCNQDFNVARLERYVAMVLEANVSPVIVLTKRDLCDLTADDDDAVDDDDDDAADDDDDNDDDDDLSWLLDYYTEEASGIAGGTVPVVCLDARDDEPRQKLEPWCQPGQTVAFLGSSGVGKSTLVNALHGFRVVETGPIHLDSGQGRHTTTHRQLHFLSNGCAVLDTPGLRELQLIHASHGVSEVFADLVDISGRCRFNDCNHSGEPGCAIAEAVENGEIDEDRFSRWEKLVEEDISNSKIAFVDRKGAKSKRPLEGKSIRKRKNKR